MTAYQLMIELNRLHNSGIDLTQIKLLSEQLHYDTYGIPSPETKPIMYIEYTPDDTTMTLA